MSRFLAAYEDLFAKSTDAPVEFGHAGGLAILSTIALRRRWIERGGEQIHPNLFMLLCADSSADRKSTSVKLATGLLKECEKYRLGPDNFTPEGLFTFMYGFMTDKGEVAAPPKKEILLPIGEFGTFLAQASGHAKNLYSEMCNFYDGADVMRARSNKKPQILENPLITLFGGVAYGMLEKYMKPDEWDMGFYPRMLWVTPITRRPQFTMVPETPFTERMIAIDRLKDLIEALKARENGFKMKLEKGADAGYDAFVKSLVLDESISDATVTAQRERLKNIIWKLAVLYQIDIDPNADISAAAMDQAYNFAHVSWASFKTVFDKTYGAIRDRFNLKVWRYIHENGTKIERYTRDSKGKLNIISDKAHGVSLTSINRWQHRKLVDLDCALTTLTTRGVIARREMVGSNGKNTAYYEILQEPPEK